MVSVAAGAACCRSPDATTTVRPPLEAIDERDKEQDGQRKIDSAVADAVTARAAAGSLQLSVNDLTARLKRTKSERETWRQMQIKAGTGGVMCERAYDGIAKGSLSSGP